MTDQPDLWAISHSRLHGEPTSYEAARSMITPAAQQCQDLLTLLMSGPLTADEADELLSWRPSTAGRRMPDLVHAGLAEFTGETRKTRSGRRANVYRATNKKEEAA